jgi:biotin synthase-related radical SAM superfamily protein
VRPEIKARLLYAGTVRITGEPVESYIARSTAGPGAGSAGAVFYSDGKGRVRLGIAPDGPVTITHLGNGLVELRYDDLFLTGSLEKPALHCPRQAFITITSACIFRCRYCVVPTLSGRKTPEEIEAMVRSVLPEIDAISLTSGVLSSISEEEEYTIGIVKLLSQFGLPIGVSIYPTRTGPLRLHDAGAVEVKFNLETATNALFREMCPDLDRGEVFRILVSSVPIFGKGHVFSNIIIGLGESDDEIRTCIDLLCENGIIPVIRPLNPGGDLAGFSRPSPERLMATHDYLTRALAENGLDPMRAKTMCPACTGCDLIPGRDA